jgi:hypothetical protein
LSSSTSLTDKEVVTGHAPIAILGSIHVGVPNLLFYWTVTGSGLVYGLVSLGNVHDVFTGILKLLG